MQLKKVPKATTNYNKKTEIKQEEKEYNKNIVH